MQEYVIIFKNEDVGRPEIGHIRLGLGNWDYVHVHVAYYIWDSRRTRSILYDSILTDESLCSLKICILLDFG